MSAGLSSRATALEYLIDDPQPRPVGLPAGDLGGRAPVREVRRRERQVSADKGWALLPELEFRPVALSST